MTAENHPGPTPAIDDMVLDVNGHERRVQVDPRTPLLFVLRNQLGLNGPQYGCGEQVCGSCKVLLDGAAVTTCRLPVERARGARIVTLDGLAEDGELHPVQQAFIELQAMQCGVCANGVIMESVALLTRHRPSPGRIRRALEDHLCRCGAHNRMVRAVTLAAERLWGTS